jgi:predicted  nucleic acid-binding Zn-ribbon protein
MSTETRVPALTKENRQTLSELQLRDSALDKLRARLAELPGEIEALKERIAQIRASAEGAKAESQKLQRQHKEMEVELGSQESAIAKHQQELNQVKSNEAFKALQKEIDLAKQKKDKLEEEILGLLDRIESAIKTSKDALAVGEKDVSLVAGEVKEREAQIERLKKELEERAGGRNEVAGKLPGELVRRYEQIRSRRGVALAAVKDGTCQGCHMKLNSQNLLEVKKGKDVVVCDGCSRILFEE